MKTVIIWIVYAFIILIIYNTLKAFVLSKLKVKKWVVALLGTVLFLLSSFLPIVISGKNYSTFWIYLSSAILIITILWLIDLQFNLMPGKRLSKDEKNDFKPKPKGKPSKKKD